MQKLNWFTHALYSDVSKKVQSALWLLTFVFNIQHAYSGNTSLDVDHSFVYSDLMGYVKVYTDPSQSKEAKEILRQHFSDPPSGTPNFSTDGLIHWISFECRNVTDLPKNLVTEIDIVYADLISFYVFDKQGKLIRKIENQNWKTPLIAREIESRYFAFKSIINAGDEISILIKIQQKAGILSCPVSLWEEREYSRYYLRYTLETLVAVGILVFLFVLSLIFGIWIRMPIILYYGLYLAGTSSYILSLEGFLAHFASAPFSDIKVYAISSGISRIGSTLFTLYFIFTPASLKSGFVQKLKYLAWFLVFVQLIWIAFCLIMPFGQYSPLISNTLSAVYILTILVFFIAGLVMKSKEAMWYLVAMLPVCFSSLFNLSTVTGLLPSGDFNYLLGYYTPIWDFTVLGIGVVYRLLRDREASMLKVQVLQNEMLSIQNEEQERIGMDLHDDLGGTVATFQAKLWQLREVMVLDDIRNGIHELLAISAKASVKLRQISHNLLPPEFGKSSLPELLRENLLPPPGMDFRLMVFGTQRPLASERELNLYRVLIEMFSNIRKHADASTCVVQLFYYDTHLCVVIEDNGMGFIKTEQFKRQGGLGSKSISLRMNYINASLETDRNGTGTSHILNIPYQPSDPASIKTN